MAGAAEAPPAQHGCGPAAGLRSLLWLALNDAPVYSALVPWILDSSQQAPSLAAHVTQRAVLQQHQLQAGCARPSDMQQAVLQLASQCCAHARRLGCDSCGPDGGMEREGGRCCSLPAPAVRLAKLHGHVLSHGLAPNLAEQLHALLLLLTSGPLPAGGGVAAGRHPSKQHLEGGRQQQQQQQPSGGGGGGQRGGAAAAAAAAGSTPAGQPPLASPEQLLRCRTCAARYAAKALECCGKLLACLPPGLLARLAASPHAQHFAPGLAGLAAKVAAAGGGLAAGAAALPSAQRAPRHQPPCPDGAAARSAPGRLEAALGSSGGGARQGLAAQAPRPAGAIAAAAAAGGPRLSGLGALLPGAHGGAKPRAAAAAAAGGAGRPGACAMAANRERSRDLFFSILRRCSGCLDALRQQQREAAAVAAAKAADGGAQDGAPCGTDGTDALAAQKLGELVAEVEVAARQLLLQLAPANLPYLAQLFCACVVQAASGGEPILEPQLALMAQREPGKFQKLQQRLAEGGAGGGGGLAARSGSGGGALPPGMPPAPRQQPLSAAAAAGGTGRQGRDQPGGAGAWGRRAGASAGSGSDSAAAPAASSSQGRPPGSSHVQSTTQQRRQQQGHAAGGDQAGGSRSAPHSTAAAAPPGDACSAAGAGSGGNPPGTAPRKIRPTPSPCSTSSLGSAASQRPPAAVGASTLPPPSGRQAAAPVTSTAAAQPATTEPSGTSGPARCAPSGASGPWQPLAPVRQACDSGAEAAGGFRAAADVAGPGQQPRAAAVHQRPGPTSHARMPGGPGGAQGAVAALAANAARPTAAALTATAAAATGGATQPRAPGQERPPAAASAMIAGQGQAGGGVPLLLRLLSEMPAGQHVLLLVLHAADSSSFNRSLMEAMLARAEELLGSCPASLTAAGGLGAQASCAVALAGYCGYLSFAAGATDGGGGGSRGPGDGHSDAFAAGGGGTAERQGHHQQQQQQLLLQQQPAVDVDALLARVTAAATAAAGAAAAADLGGSWQLALAVPFACAYLRFAGMHPLAAASPCVRSAVRQLRALAALPCMSPGHPAYGALPACLSSCMRSCQALQLQRPCDSLAGAAAAAASEGNQDSAQAAAAAPAAAAGASPASDSLCQALAQGNALVDGAFWGICCPGLQQLSSLLDEADAAAVAAAQQQQQQQHRGAPRVPRNASQGSMDSTDSSPAPAAPAAAAAQRAPTADAGGDASNAGAAASAGGSSTSSGGPSAGPSGVTQRHATPLLLAPRTPPALDEPPECVAAALAEAVDPLRQQLQQSFVAQYSTDDNPVKMRDVLAVVNGILCANSLSLALSQGVPGVLQQHVDAMQREVLHRVAPTGGGGESSTALEGQDLARAVHAICTQHSAPAVHAALDSAMRRAAEHATAAAAAACSSLLPGEVPPAAVSAAAAMVAASCKASCAQHLLHEVPVLVQSALADHADDLVRVVSRQWAVHSRMTQAPAASVAVPPRCPEATDTQADGGPAAAGACPSHGSGVQEGARGGVRRISPMPVAPSGAEADDASSAAAARLRQQQCNASPVLCSAVQQAAECQAGSGAAAPAASAASDGVVSLPSGQPAHSGAAVAAAAAEASTQPACREAAEPAVLEPAAGELSASAGDADGCCPATPEALQPPPPSASSGSAGASGVPGREQVLQQLRRQLAAAAATRAPHDCVQRVIGSYMSAATSLAPPACATWDPAHDARHWEGVVAAAECAAAALARQAASAPGAFDEVEAQLALRLEQLCIGDDGGGGGGDSLQVQLFELLAGSVLYAFVCSSNRAASVWRAGGPAGRAGAEPPPTFSKLPALVMRVARADRPVWLLQQLRAWLQDATLGRAG